MKRLIFCLIQLAIVTANASPRSSANYSLSPEALDAGGKRITSANYTVATAQGVASGFTATLNLTVLNTIADNFGNYAGDGLDDAWQVQYFGPNNPQAAPGADPDGDGHDNKFEYTAGLSPVDPNSHFTLSIARVPGQPTQMNLIFAPIIAGRTYTVRAKTDLTSSTWNAVTVSPPIDTGAQRTVTDLAASGVRKFYRIEITKP